MTAPETSVAVPAGMVAVTTYGLITHETASSLLEMRSKTEEQGLKNIVWTFMPGTLVDRARNSSVATMLAHAGKLGWLVFVDGDAAFEPDALLRLLTFAYAEQPLADIVGAYCTLRGDPYLPTIDTGTGTWEPWRPGQGGLEVMRTGSAFVLIKRHVYEGLEAPWYGVRLPKRPIDAMAEVDNFAHMRFDGTNPLARYPEWQTLLRCAKDDPASRRPPQTDAFVGEDSNFCDRAKLAGFRVFVQSDVEVLHVEHALRGATDLARAMETRENNRRALYGITPQ